MADNRNTALGFQMKAYLVNLLKAKGFQGNPEVAATGILGNLAIESGNFDPNVISGKRRGDKGKAIGLAQWHPERWATISQTAKNARLDPLTWQGQLYGLVEELYTSERGALRRLATADTPEAAADAFLYYERPSGIQEGGAKGVPSRDERVNYARLYSGEIGPNKIAAINRDVLGLDRSDSAARVTVDSMIDNMLTPNKNAFPINDNSLQGFDALTNPARPIEPIDGQPITPPERGVGLGYDPLTGLRNEPYKPISIENLLLIGRQ